jgi:ketosteroid isomerase-like protein
MRTFRTAVGLGVFFVLGAAAIAAPADGPGEVEALERQLVAAIGSGDLATYDRIVADDYVAFEASGKTTPKKDIIESYRSGARHYTNLEIFDVEGRIFGDTAVVTAKTKGLRKEGDRDVPNRVRYIRVFARRDGRWRAVAQMASLMTESGPPAGRDATLTGSWGGDHVGLEATPTGAQLDFDCAHGTIDEAIRLDADGRFDAKGTYEREGPGPVRKDVPAKTAARYRGVVRGDTMSLTVEPAGFDAEFPALELGRGRLPRVRKCG